MVAADAEQVNGRRAIRQSEARKLEEQNERVNTQQE